MVECHFTMFLTKLSNDLEGPLNSNIQMNLKI